MSLSESEEYKPAPLPKNEARRLEAVKRTGVMDVDNTDLFIVYNELAKQISNMPVSYTGLIDEERQYFLCHVGMPEDMPESVPREFTFCQYALNSTNPLIVENCKLDDRFKNNPIVTNPPFVTFYAGFPIVNEGGMVLGTLCVTDIKPNKLDYNQINLLEKLTGRLAHQLEIQSAQREITAFKTIDLLLKLKKRFVDFEIEDIIAYLSIINGQNISEEMLQRLKNYDLIYQNSQLSTLGRQVQKEIGIDSGIFRRIVISNDRKEDSLDHLLENLDVI